MCVDVSHRPTSLLSNMTLLFILSFCRFVQVDKKPFGNGTGDVGRKPSVRRQEKAPEGREPHVDQDDFANESDIGVHDGGGSVAEGSAHGGSQGGGAGAGGESRFTEQL